jgi:hypothetical protein
MAEVAVPKELFQEILQLIAMLRCCGRRQFKPEPFGDNVCRATTGDVRRADREVAPRSTLNLPLWEARGAIAVNQSPAPLCRRLKRRIVTLGFKP